MTRSIRGVTRRQEEGQVYPALLLAVIGAFALALIFVSLQNLLDQTGRADTAADAAALGAGEAHRDWVEDRLAELFEGNSGLHLGAVLDLVENPTPNPRVLREAAEAFADANGAEVPPGGFESQGPQFMAGGGIRYTYRVTTRQNDTVKGGNSSERAESTATARIELRLPTAQQITQAVDDAIAEAAGDLLGDVRDELEAKYFKECMEDPPEAGPEGKPTPEEQCRKTAKERAEAEAGAKAEEDARNGLNLGSVLGDLLGGLPDPEVELVN